MQVERGAGNSNKDGREATHGGFMIHDGYDVRRIVGSDGFLAVVSCKGTKTRIGRLTWDENGQVIAARIELRCSGSLYRQEIDDRQGVMGKHHGGKKRGNNLAIHCCEVVNYS